MYIINASIGCDTYVLPVAVATHEHDPDDEQVGHDLPCNWSALPLALGASRSFIVPLAAAACAGPF
jgi:hypothetical protein